MTTRPIDSTPSTASHEDASILLLVDSNGIIHAAGEQAISLLGIPAEKLPSESAAALFAFEVVSKDPEMLAAQWDALIASTTQGPVDLDLNANGEAGAPVSVEIVRAVGLEGRHFLKISPRRTTAAAAAQPEGSMCGLLELNSPAGFFDLNFKESSIHYTPVWKRMLGYVDAELPDTYDTWLELLHPEDSAAAPDKIGRKAHPPGMQPFSVEFRMKHRDGHWVWILCLGVRVFSDDSKLERVNGLHIDISERKELEEAGLAAEERLRSLCEEGPVCAFLFDFQQGTSWISASLKRLLGYEDDELPGSAEDFLHLLPEEEKEVGLPYWFASKGGSASADSPAPSVSATRKAEASR